MLCVCMHLDFKSCKLMITKKYFFANGAHLHALKIAASK